MRTEKPELAFQVHDLRSKISAAVSFVELLERDSPEVASNPLLESIRECLSGAIDSSRELSLALTDPEEASQAKPGSVAASPDTSRQKFAPAKDVITVHAPAAYAALSRQFPIEIDYSYVLLDGDYVLSMGAREITSIRENVVANAVDSGASRLEICYEMKEYGLLITMSDNGRGMSADELNRLRLQQLGDGRVHGLGTRRILTAARSQDSVVTYISAPDEGTTVSILCPYIEGVALDMKNRSFQVPGAKQAE